MKSKIQKWNFSEITTMKNIRDNVGHVPYVNWFILKFSKLLLDRWWCDFWIIFMETTTKGMFRCHLFCWNWKIIVESTVDKGKN